MSINVLIADDSAFLRKTISEILKQHESINIVDFAKDGVETIKLVKKYNPDVLVLDLVMPKKNGLDAFKEIMEEHPTPTIILSAISPKNLDSSIQALLMGAFDYIIKPGGFGAKNLPQFREELLAKVILASQSQIRRIFTTEENLLERHKFIRQEMVDRIFNFGQYINKLKPIGEFEEKRETDSFEIMKVKAILRNENDPESFEKYTNIKEKDSIIQKAQITSKTLKTKTQKLVPFPDLSPFKGILLKSNIIVIGASVGGPRTISTILREIPRSFKAPILIVQHLSSHFTEAFADNLNLECELKISVAKNGDSLQAGHVYIAPGDMHMEITIDNKMPSLKIFKGTPVNFCMPSIDILFFSAAKIFRNRTLGILLTGMGFDGVEGLNAIKKVGGKTIAESEDTSILYAMPKFAAEKGYVDLILPNYEIKDEIVKFIENTSV